LQSETVRAEPCELSDIRLMRESFVEEACCQIVRYSILPRKLAAPYLIFFEGEVAGYGAIGTAHFPGRIMEFFAIPSRRDRAAEMLSALAQAGDATQAEAQSNIPWTHSVWLAATENRREDYLLFEDGGPSRLTCPGMKFRVRDDRDAGQVFEHRHEPVGNWVVEDDEGIAATGGYFTHYNPPYADIYMEVAERARGRGVGSFLVRELMRVCREMGLRPAARCVPSNVASRKTLEKAGMRVCGSLDAGDLRE
jgi:GNAT superfamily N-acetyltransferase